MRHCYELQACLQQHTIVHHGNTIKVYFACHLVLNCQGIAKVTNMTSCDFSVPHKLIYLGQEDYHKEALEHLGCLLVVCGHPCHHICIHKLMELADKGNQDLTCLGWIIMW
jgi:hypothetical protein